MEVKEQVALEKINVIKEVRDIIANKGFYFTPQEGEEINMLLKKICADASKDLAGCNKETQKANPDIAKVATSAMTDAITYGADGVRKFIRMVNEETARKLSEKRLKKATGVERSQKEGEDNGMEKTEAELYGAELGKLSILPDLETPDEELKKILAKQVELLHQRSNHASTSELIELSKVMASLLALQGGNQSFYGVSMNHPYVVQLPVGDLIDLYVLRAQKNGYPIVDLRKSTCQEQKN